MLHTLGGNLATGDTLWLVDTSAPKGSRRPGAVRFWAACLLLSAAGAAAAGGGAHGSALGGGGGGGGGRWSAALAVHVLAMGAAVGAMSEGMVRRCNQRKPSV